MFFGYIFLSELNFKKIPPLSSSLPFILISMYLVVILVSAFSLVQSNYLTLEKNKNLENDFLQAQLRLKMEELKFLRMQIHPHFLFNTLNNIYGLAYLKDERAAVMISKLSKLLRYLLYDCDQSKVRLANEKDLIENYLSVQLLKHEDVQNVDFYHAGIANGNMIAPMILINFIENCFKHSDLESNPQGWIKISMEVENNELNFRTENTVREEIEETSMEHKGIVLTNSLKLLEANYPEKHKVDITKENHVYRLDLKMTL